MSCVKRVFAVFLSFVLFLGVMPPVAAGAQEEPLVLSDGRFSYTSAFLKETDAAVVSCSFSYDESWFLQDSREYHHDLARMSLRMAMAAAAATGENITALLETLAFRDITIHDPKPTRDTIGYAIASKPFPAAGENVTLIAVAIRGGGYGEEWADNFRVGTEGEHAGFRNAAQQVVSAIQAHIQTYGISGELKLWITGYSRGAAVTNLAAHRLNAAAGTGDFAGLSQDALWAYCFEGPASVRRDMVEEAPWDANIFSILNPQDIVPLFAPDNWDFTQYGTAYCLPFAGTEYDQWNSLLAGMREQYRKILIQAGVPEGEAGTRVKSLTAFLPAQSLLLKQTVDILATHYESQQVYAREHENTVMDGLEALFTGDGSIRSLITMFSSTMPFLLHQHRTIANTLIENVDAVTQAHYPELCLAWMDSLTQAQLQMPALARLLTVNGNAEVSVYDSQGRLAGRIAANGTRSGNLEGYTDENGQKRLILPGGEAFQITLTPASGGTLDWQLEEYDFASRRCIRLTSYRDVPVEKGAVITGSHTGFADSGGSTISPSLELPGEQVERYAVTVSQEGTGTVTGGGSFTMGEYALVTAQPGKGKPFYGWYVDGNLVSQELSCRFRVEADTIITGYFEAYIPPQPPEQPEIPEPPTEPEIQETAPQRVAGADRFETAFLTADALKRQLGVERFEAILVASGTGFADALSGSYLASVKKAPILLSFRDSINERVKDYIRANLVPGGTVYILGGEAAVPASMEEGLEHFTVTRLAGSDRFGTNLAILEEAGGLEQELLVCTGLEFADSLSAAACAKPILLVWQTLTKPQQAFLASRQKDSLYIIGGEAAVSGSMEAALSAYGETTRIGGSNRFETSVKIAEHFFAQPTSAVLAYAWNYPDGLCGGPLASVMGAPLLLTMTGYDAAAVEYASRHTLAGGTILGGETLISPDCAAGILGRMEE